MDAGETLLQAVATKRKRADVERIAVARKATSLLAERLQLGKKVETYRKQNLEVRDRLQHLCCESFDFWFVGDGSRTS